MNNINWYPGHMKKTRELIQQNLKLVDVLIEVVDARIPVSSRNPILDDIAGNKRRFIVLNKSDLADAAENEKWLGLFRQTGFNAVRMNSMSGEGVKELLKTLTKIQNERNKEAAVKRSLRLMIAGVPNVGKSSLVNRLIGRKSAMTGDRPGVTKGKQWLALENGIQLLDTPGILWPKFEDPAAGINLALCGAIKDEILDVEDLALTLVDKLLTDYQGLLSSRYKITIADYSEQNVVRLNNNFNGQNSETTYAGNTEKNNETTYTGATGKNENTAVTDNSDKNKNVFSPGYVGKGETFGQNESPFISDPSDSDDIDNQKPGSNNQIDNKIEIGHNPSSLQVMESIARKRGFLLSGGRTDYLRTANVLLDEFRSGAIGHITLERL